jgi:hypothetical protein
MVCLNLHFFQSLLKSPRSENVIFAVLYASFVDRSDKSVGNEVLFTIDYALGPHLWVIKVMNPVNLVLLLFRLGICSYVFSDK